MSDGTFNKPVRNTHPDTPSSGRVKDYIYNDNGTPTPYFLGDDGVPRTLKGEDGQDGANGLDGQDGATGPQGDVGPQGPQGLQGPQGPPGAMTVEALIGRTTTVTLPNSSNLNLIYFDPISFDGAGDAYLDISLSCKPHSSSTDTEFYVYFDGFLLAPEYVEEHKDTSNSQSPWRSFCFPLGNVLSGPHTVALYYSKESKGGTGQLKAYTLKAVRYS